MSQAAEVATPVASLSLVSRHDEAALRDALASFPSGVTIVTTSTNSNVIAAASATLNSRSPVRKMR